MNRNKWIALLLFLLLLLIILCTWCHSSDIAKKRLLIETKTIEKTSNTKHKVIDYSLQKDDKNFTLMGNFNNKEDINLLRAALSTDKLQESTHIDSSLEASTEAITLTQKLIPLFKKSYINGKISYQDGKLTVEGTVQNSTAKDDMSTLLANSKLPTINNTKVIFVPTKPVNFRIEKKESQLTLNGVVQSQAEVNRLLGAIDSDTLKKELTINDRLIIETDIFDVSEKLIQLLKEQYKEGSITYANQKLNIEGIVDNEEAKQAMEKVLQESPLAYINHTEVVPPQPTQEELDALQAAKEAEIEAQKKAESEAEAKKLAEEARKIEVEIKQVVDLENIRFESNKAILTKKSIETINHIALILEQHPALLIEIGGHTDSDGSDAYNLALSQKRVDSVKGKLIELGINANRLTAIGYGESKPLIDNNSQENKQLNRRVEFKVKGE